MLVTLLHTPPALGQERVPGGRDAQRQHGPAALDEVASYARLAAPSPHQGKRWRSAMLRAASLECAAGAAPERCRQWFSAIAQVALLPHAGQPAAPAEAAIYLALAGEFRAAGQIDWPREIDTQQTSARVLYRMVAGVPLAIPEHDALFDGAHWLRAARAAQRGDPAEAQAACEALADWWLHDYEATETPIDDLASYPCFEPDCNALCATLLRRAGLPLAFAHERHRRFYLAALLGQG